MPASHELQPLIHNRMLLPEHLIMVIRRRGIKGRKEHHFSKVKSNNVHVGNKNLVFKGCTLSNKEQRRM